MSHINSTLIVGAMHKITVSSHRNDREDEETFLHLATNEVNVTVSKWKVF